MPATSLYVFRATCSRYQHGPDFVLLQTLNRLDAFAMQALWLLSSWLSQYRPIRILLGCWWPTVFSYFAQCFTMLLSQFYLHILNVPTMWETDMTTLSQIEKNAQLNRQHYISDNCTNSLTDCTVCVCFCRVAFWQLLLNEYYIVNIILTEKEVKLLFEKKNYRLK